jgi:hypothetical protein
LHPIWRPHYQDRIAPIGARAIDIGIKLDAVAHRDCPVAFDFDFVQEGGRINWRYRNDSEKAEK